MEDEQLDDIIKKTEDRLKSCWILIKKLPDNDSLLLKMELLQSALNTAIVSYKKTKEDELFYNVYFIIGILHSFFLDQINEEKYEKNRIEQTVNVLFDIWVKEYRGLYNGKQRTEKID